MTHPNSARRLQALGATGRKDWFQIRSERTTAGSSVAKVYIYDRIGYSWFFGGVSAQDFVHQLDELDVDEIHVHINSPGGDYYDGLAIMNALRHHDARVVAYVDGLAASAATLVALGADEVVMSLGAEYMIHDAWSIAIGDAADMREAATDLDRVSNNAAKLYARKAGGTAADWRALMVAETWYSDTEAVAAGLADRVDEDTSEDDEQDIPVSAAWDLSVFAHAGRKAAPAPPTVAASLHARGGKLPPGSTRVRNNTTGRPERLHTPPAASAVGSTPPAAPAPGDTSPKGAAVAFTEEQLNTMRQAVGVSNDADEQTILDALAESLEERADAVPTTTSQAIPEGTTLIDEGTLAQLRDDAQAGREARTQQQAERREAQVQAAISQGQIPPSRADAWRGMLAADPGAAETLAGLPTGTVPLDELGHADTGPQSADPVDKNLAAMGWGPTQTKES